jgi:hypothetical protein
MLEGSKEVMNESRNLEKLTQEITESIDTLLEEVSRFKVN